MADNSVTVVICIDDELVEKELGITFKKVYDKLRVPLIKAEYSETHSLKETNIDYFHGVCHYIVYGEKGKAVDAQIDDMNCEVKIMDVHHIYLTLKTKYGLSDKAVKIASIPRNAHVLIDQAECSGRDYTIHGWCDNYINLHDDSLSSLRMIKLSEWLDV